MPDAHGWISSVRDQLVNHRYRLIGHDRDRLWLGQDALNSVATFASLNLSHGVDYRVLRSYRAIAYTVTVICHAATSRSLTIVHFGIRAFSSRPTFRSPATCSRGDLTAATMRWVSMSYSNARLRHLRRSPIRPSSIRARGSKLN